MYNNYKYNKKNNIHLKSEDTIKLFRAFNCSVTIHIIDIIVKTNFIYFHIL